MPTTIGAIDYAPASRVQLLAHYTATRTKHGTTRFIAIGVIVDGRHAVSEIIPVNGKREARAIAYRFSATPWNF
jgi:hypothetical protein